MPAHSDTGLEAVDEVVHEPDREFVESANVADFMQKYDIDDYDELIERTTGEVDGLERRVSTGSGTPSSTISRLTFTRRTTRPGTTVTARSLRTGIPAANSTSHITSATATLPSSRNAGTRSRPSGRAKTATFER